MVRASPRARTTLHAVCRRGRSAANTPEGVTLTQRREPLVSCRCWPQRVATRIGHLRGASRQDVVRCWRDKLDVACCGVCNHDLSLNCSRIRPPTDRRLSCQGDGRLTSKMVLGVVKTSSMLFLFCFATATEKQSVITIRILQDADWEGCSDNGLPLICPNQKPFGHVV